MTLEKEVYDYYFSAGSNFEKWTIFKEIGSGGMGKVFLAYMQDIYKNKNYAAIKILPASQISLPLFQKFLKQEYAILSNLSDHINIVKLLPQDSYFVYKGGEEVYYLTLEYCPGGNLAQFVQSYDKNIMPVGDAFLILEQILRGVLYAHERNIIHGDICEENILLMRPNNFKIADFGVANIARNEIFMQGKRLLYQAPETFEYERISSKTDIWSIGVLIYKLITGRFPFFAQDEKKLLYLINKETINFPEHLQNIDVNTINGSIVYFIKQMLSINPGKRPSAKELYNAVQRCRHLLVSNEIEAFESRFIKQVELQDQKPKEEPKNITLAKPSKKIERTFLERKKWNLSNITTIIICLIGIGIFSYFVLFQKEKKPSVELFLKTEIPNFRYRITVVARRPSGQRIALRHIRGQKVRIFIGYIHQSGIMKEFDAPIKAITGNYIWEIPDNIPDGKITLWAKYVWKNNKAISSKYIHLNIIGLQKQRKFLKLLNEMEYLKSPEEEIIKKYERYCSLYPKGIFYEKAIKKIAMYRLKIEMRDFISLIKFIKTNPKKYKEILSNIQIFLKKYPHSQKKNPLINIRRFYEDLKVSKKYVITLLNGFIENKILKADPYIKIYKNKKLIFESSVIKDNNKPVWNKQISLQWKIGDSFRVEMWDKNVSIWNDKLYFSIENVTEFAIEIFFGKIGNKKQWVFFKTNFSFEKKLQKILSPTHSKPG